METLIYKDGILKIFDQKKLPLAEEYLNCKSYTEVIKAIKELSVRGAPAIGIAALYASVLAARECHTKEELANALWEIKSARPTAVNLEWAVNKALKAMDNIPFEMCEEKFLKLADEAYETEIETDKKMGEAGASLIKDGMNIITHCNTGSLATSGIGTALGVIITAFNQGKKIHVYADETRPLLQGSRLTAYELKKAGIPFHLICDSVAPFLIKEGKADIVFVGADRIAKNGDTANKIGTFSLSLACKTYGVPFYVVAPKSSYDLSINSGSGIVIEERGEGEVCEIGGVRIAPIDTPVYNPAFDITPWENITGIISEDGIHYPKIGGFELCME